ncbi:peptide chain release factor N(5)-glutamine methyltransferase [Candidatus Bipolaricaulota bacterium]|nr:peptide chain release factor N(5)-glutamine methyltransferase [Candidatus Bipolaricaulota bacterium]HHR85150.1 peptide chain release factor N(5)-glutamine methyltransferase [Candidatus Acetothermia bacterium]
MGGSALTVKWTVREILKWTRGYFKGAGIPQPRLEAEILLAHVMNVDRLHLYLSPDTPLTPDERARFREIIKKRRSGVPRQYLTGEVQFYGLRFRVRDDVFIPRPETEELLEKALGLVPRDRALTCLDLGTGSGVIAISLAKYLPRVKVMAVDLSTEAVELAQENAELNEVIDRVDVVRSNWFEHVPGKFDLVVSNPPYIPEEEMDNLPDEVREHEPHRALDGGRDGMEEIAKLVAGLKEHMHSGAMALFEIGHGQGTMIREEMEDAGLTDIRVERDFAERERYVIARCPS